jgi:hypothetical protein
MKIHGILCLFLAALLSGGCYPSQTIAREPQGSPLGLPTQGYKSPMTPSAPWLQSLTEKAKEDLAKRLSITVTEIGVAEAAGVIWPDSSLGCPQKGMAYAEVLTPGYLILLEYANKKYEYHAGKGPEVFYCKNPTPPLPGTPDNT